MQHSGRLTLPAPAKLNLFLRVTRRRPDGYHDLQTVFQFIDLCDDIELVSRSDGRIVRAVPIGGVSEEQDLCVRAASALKRAANVRDGVEIGVTKRIPMGAGLGGGSSDAASVLLGLNRLWGLAMTPDELARIGATLGADVPVFVRGDAAWAEGVGEKLTPIALEQRDLVLALPSVHVPTASIFVAPELTRDCVPLTIRSFPLFGRFRRVHHLMVAGNVCEAVVRSRHPAVAACLDWLHTMGPARMTGTGSACFGLAVRGDTAVGPPCPVMRVRGVNRSPALAALGR